MVILGGNMPLLLLLLTNSCVRSETQYGSHTHHTMSTYDWQLLCQNLGDSRTHHVEHHWWNEDLTSVICIICDTECECMVQNESFDSISAF